MRTQRRIAWEPLPTGGRQNVRSSAPPCHRQPGLARKCQPSEFTSCISSRSGRLTPLVPGPGKQVAPSQPPGRPDDSARCAAIVSKRARVPGACEVAASCAAPKSCCSQIEASPRRRLEPRVRRRSGKVPPSRGHGLPKRRAPAGHVISPVRATSEAAPGR